MTTPPQILNRIYEIRLDDLSKSKFEIHLQLRREGINVAHKVIQKVINRHLELLNQRKQLADNLYAKTAANQPFNATDEQNFNTYISLTNQCLFKN